MPRRIQLRRAKGWRLADESPNAVIVSRPGKWGNPISLAETAAHYPSLDDFQVARLAVRDFKVLAQRGRLWFPNWLHLDGHRGPVEWTYPAVAEIRAELAGRDLACWCPPDHPCHADVLLHIANEEVTL